MSNILLEVHPELIGEWSDKNLPLTPDKITFGSNKRVWWKGACGRMVEEEYIEADRGFHRSHKKIVWKGKCGLVYNIYWQISELFLK